MAQVIDRRTLGIPPEVESARADVEGFLSETRRLADESAENAQAALASATRSENAAQIAHDLVAASSGIVFSDVEPPVSRRRDGLAWLVPDMDKLTFAVKRWDTTQAGNAPYPSESLWPGSALWPSPAGVWQDFKVAKSAQE